MFDSMTDVPHCARLGKIQALLVGAGRGGVAIIHVFRHYDWLWLRAVVDIDENAIGMELAKTMAIPTYSNAADIVPEFDGDLIIDVTGDPTLAPALLAMRRKKSIDIISGKAAKLLYDLVRNQIHHQERIQQKVMQLELFKAMLDISKQLEATGEQNSLLGHGVQSSAQLIVAHKALAVDCAANEMNIVGGIGFEKVPAHVDREILDAIIDRMSEHAGEICVEIPDALVLPGIDDGFQLGVPIYLDGVLCYLMLFQIPLPVTRATREILETLIAHLELALLAHRRFKSLEEMAYRDPLTGLYNRRYFDERLSEELERSRRTGANELALMFMDLDHFKELNDTLGHAVGDKALKVIATAIHDRFRPYDVLARYGGDEFVAILPGVTENTLQTICRRVLAAFNHEENAALAQLTAGERLGLSIGACLVRGGSRLSAADILKRADEALYRAKQAGRGNVEVTVIDA